MGREAEGHAVWRGDSGAVKVLLGAMESSCAARSRPGFGAMG